MTLSRHLLFSKLVPLFIISLITVACTGNRHNAELLFTFGDEGTNPGQFRYVEDFAIDDLGNLLITDALNANVQVFTADGNFISMFGDSDQL